MRKNGTNMMELTEPMEPRKRRHGLLGGASSHTRRGPGLREFMNKLPQIMEAATAAD